jgi:hypothetical protein
MPVDVLTNRYSPSRAGVNDRETTLIKRLVEPAGFGKLFARTVDGDLYAQPLIVSDLTIAGRKRDVVYLATSRNWVYAYDADDPLEYRPLWTRQLGQAVPRDAIEKGYLNFGGEVGVTSTPAIDRGDAGGAIFVATKTMEGDRDRPSFAYRLHALDILTGEDRAPAVLIEATLKDRPNVRFDPAAAAGQRRLSRLRITRRHGRLFRLDFGLRRGDARSDRSLRHSAGMGRGRRLAVRHGPSRRRRRLRLRGCRQRAKP